MTGQGGIVVSKKDLLRIKVISMFRERKINREEAADRLDLGERQVSRLAGILGEKGPQGLLHQGRGRSPANKKPDELLEKYETLYREKYVKFNFTHALEMIEESSDSQELEKISYSTFRRWCRSKSLGKTKPRRSSKAHVHRQRLAEEGAMLQLDGSDHRWREKGKTKDCLIAFIDDATSKVPYAQFHPGETTWACFEGLKHILETKGIPEIIVTDRAGWSDRGDKRFHFSQFARLCEDLGIALIATSLAQSKGRIERLFRTWQDRLVAELDFCGISSRQDANRYIDQCFLQKWDEKFTVEPAKPKIRYRSASHIDLDYHFCLKYRRSGNKNNTVGFEGRQYRIHNREFGSIFKKEIWVHKHQDGRLEFYYGHNRLDHELIELRRKRRRA